MLYTTGEALVLIAVTCPYCQSDQAWKRRKTDSGKQRSHCHNLDCRYQSFLLNPAYKGPLLEIKQHIYKTMKSRSRT